MKRVWWMVLFLSVFVFGVGSISIVWLRMEISDTAKICGRMEDEREMVARELRELRGQRSKLMRPAMLASMVAGRLSMPPSSRTVHVTGREMATRLGGNLGVENWQGYQGSALADSR